MAGALAVTIMTSSALSVEAAGSGYSGTVLQTTVAGRYTSKKFAGTAVSSARANVDAALGVQKGEKAWISISDSTCGQKAMKTVTDVAESSL